MRIAFKYCGGCNPEIDLAAIGRSLAALAEEQGWHLVTVNTDVEADVLVLLCGCPRTCIDREDLRHQRRPVVLVAGKRLGWRPVTEAALPQAVMDTIQNYDEPGLRKRRVC